MKYLSKLLRIIQNPKRYAAVFPYRFWGTLLIIKLYRKVVLPYLVRRTRNKDKINVIFLAMNTDMWRYDGVYRRLSNDSRYSPLIVTAMRNIPEIQQQLVEQANMLDFFSKKGYNVIPGLDTETHRWAFSKTSLNIWKFTVHVLLKSALENFEHYFTSV